MNFNIYSDFSRRIYLYSWQTFFPSPPYTHTEDHYFSCYALLTACHLFRTNGWHALIYSLLLLIRQLLNVHIPPKHAKRKEIKTVQKQTLMQIMCLAEPDSLFHNYTGQDNHKRPQEHYFFGNSIEVLCYLRGGRGTVCRCFIWDRYFMGTYLVRSKMLIKLSVSHCQASVHGNEEPIPYNNPSVIVSTIK